MDIGNHSGNEWLTLSEAAKIVNLDVRTLERLIQVHSVPVISLDRGFRVTLNDLELIKKPLPTAASEPLGMSVSDLPLGQPLDEPVTNGKIVGVVSSSDLSQKGVVALLLGKALTKLKDARVCVVDLNQGNLLGEISFLTGATKPTLLNLRLNGVSDKTIEDTVITDAGLGVDLMLAPIRPHDEEETPTHFVEELLTKLSQQYDYVIVNTSSGVGNEQARLATLVAAEAIIYVTDITVPAVFSMTRWIQITTKPESSGGMGINPNKIGVVVNNAMADVNMSSEKIERSSLGLPIIAVIPAVGQRLVRAINLQALDTVLDASDMDDAYRRLARSLG